MSHTAHDVKLPRNGWEQVGSYLRRPHVLLLNDSNKDALLAQWNEITTQEANLDDAILIGLVGGTGVGKSTLINALASEQISRSGDRRPTTNRVVVYRHSGTELPDDLPLEHLAQPQVLHSRGPLSKVILFDFPDFDSVESTHAEILRQFLPHLDVLLVIVDDMKYADLALYQLLSTLDHDDQNLFLIFNKVDKLERRYPGRAEEVEQDLLRDFRSKLAEHAGIQVDPSHQFAIAAQPVLEFRLQGEASDLRTARQSQLLQRFGQIEELVERYQQDKHRRRAKERNLDARKTRLATELRDAAIGPENRAIIRESQLLVQNWRDELNKSLAAIPTEIFSDEMRRSIRKTHLRRESSAWGIPVSLIMTLLTETIGRGRSESARQPTELAARFQAHYQPFFQALRNLKERFSAEFAGSTLALADPRTQQESELKSKGVTLDAAREFLTDLQQKEEPPSRALRLGTHLPALAVLALAIWSQLHPILASASGESERGLLRSLVGALVGSLSPTFLIGTLLAVTLAYALTAGWCWLRVIHRTDAAILEGEVDVRQKVTQFGEETVGQLDAKVHQLHQEFAELDKLLGRMKDEG